MTSRISMTWGSLLGKIIYISEWKIKKAVEEASANVNKKVKLPPEIYVHATSVDYIALMMKYGYKVLNVGPKYVLLTLTGGPDAS